MEKTSAAYQGVAWSVWGTEALGVIFDLRWGLVLIVALLITDFWWGKSESALLYEEAKKSGNQIGMEAYRFRWSRAIRRTVNKAVDYITFLLIGTLIGLAITEQYDLFTHTQTAAIGLLGAIVIEILSIWGHIKVVRHIGDDKLSIATKIAKAILRTKSHEIADAIDVITTDKPKEESYGDNNEHGYRPED